MSDQGLSIFDEEPTAEEELGGTDDATQVMPAVGKEQTSKSSGTSGKSATTKTQRCPR